ncbi:MAG: hypothetical protein ACQEVA_20890, partial [Myxococcota bacterium]
MHPSRHIFLAALTAVLVCCTATPGIAQSTPGEPTPTSDEEREKKLAELMGQLQITSIMLSFRHSFEQQRKLTDDEGHMMNAVIVADPDRLGRSRAGSSNIGQEPSADPSFGARDCINPPTEKRARYTAAYLNIAPRFDSFSGRTSGYKLDEQQLAPELAKKFLAPKLSDGQPGVLILVNRGEGDFAYHLDDAWPERDAARRWIDGELGEDVDDDEAVCEVADAVEDLLSRARDASIDELLRQRRLSRKLAEIRDSFDGIRRRIERDASDTGLYAEQMRGDIERAMEQFGRAQEHLERDELEQTAAALDRAERATSEANSTYLALMSLQNQAAEMREELDQLREDTELRRVHFLPYGEEVDAQLQSCEERFATFADRARAGNSIDDTRAAQQRASTCIDGLRDLRTSTRERFDLVVFYVPGGLFAGLFLLLAILLGRRRGR